jgi:hypothetical protein
MISLLRAEWQKITGNRPVLIFIVLFFAIFAAIATIVIVLINLATPPAFRTAARWDEMILSAWLVPGSELGRWLMLALTAVLFAGEYQWGTWKNVLLRAQRAPLVLAKFVMVNFAMLVGFGLMSIVLGIGGGLISASGLRPYEPAVTGETLSAFGRTLTLQIGLALVTTTIGAGYAAVAAIFSRSILGGIGVGFGLTFVESLLPLGLMLVGSLLRVPEIAGLYLLTPAYNIRNAGTWLLRGNGELFQVSGLAFGPNDLSLSLGILTAWVVGLIGLTIYLFRRQDITT